MSLEAIGIVLGALGLAVSIYYGQKALRHTGEKSPAADEPGGEVKVGCGFLGYGPNHELGEEQMALITFVNHRDHPVRWASAGLELPDKRRAFFLATSPGGELPRTVPAHDSALTWMPLAELERGGVDLQQPVVAFARTGTDEEFRAEPRALDAGPADG